MVFFIAFFSAALLILLIKTGLEFEVRASSYAIELEGALKLLIFIRIPVYLRLLITKPGGPALLIRMAGRTKAVPLMREKKRRASIKPDMSKLETVVKKVRCGVGVDGDAYLTAMLTGVIESSVLTLLAPKGRRAEVTVAPCFTSDMFFIAVSGIIRMRNAQIIYAAICGILSRRKKQDAPDREHNEEQHGADTRDGGC